MARCVVKFDEGYLKGTDGWNMDVVSDINKARVYSGTGPAKSSVKNLQYLINNKGWHNMRIVGVTLCEIPDLSPDVRDYFN